MIVQNNIPGFNASRNKGIVEGKMRKNLEKLSTGYRINRAGDDAAGLAISELMRSQISGLNQSIRNVNDGISMTQTGEGALTEVHSMLGRLKTLATQAANGTYTTVARENLESERLQLMDELNRIGQATDFDEIPLFGYSEEDGLFDDPDYQPPKQLDDIRLQIGHSRPEILDIGRYYLSDKALLLDKTSFKTQPEANEAMERIDIAIEAIADIRAEFGAAQNHLEHTHSNLSVTAENMSSAESRIRDTDMAELFTEYTKDNIVYQSATSMVAQANQLPGTILSLLQ